MTNPNRITIEKENHRYMFRYYYGDEAAVLKAALVLKNSGTTNFSNREITDLILGLGDLIKMDMEYRRTK